MNKKEKEKQDRKLIQQQTLWQLAFVPIIMLLMMGIAALFDIEPQLVWVFVLIVAAGLPLVRGFKMPAWMLLAGLVIMASTSFRVGLKTGGQVLTFSGLILLLFGSLVLTSLMMALVQALFHTERKRPLLLGGILLVVYGLIGAGIATDGFRSGRSQKKGPPQIDAAEQVESYYPDNKKDSLSYVMPDFAYTEVDWEQEEFPKEVFKLEEYFETRYQRSGYLPPFEGKYFYCRGEIVARGTYKTEDKDKMGISHQRIRVAFGKFFIDVKHDIRVRKPLEEEATGTIAVLGTYHANKGFETLVTDTDSLKGWILWNGKRY